jgi:transcriptional regulator with XRE-family HTH domain
MGDVHEENGSRDAVASTRRRIRGFAVRGELLRRRRRAQGWTQEEAAYRAGVSDKLIRKAERGGPIDGRSVSALAALFSTNEQPLASRELLAGETDASAPAMPSTACQLLQSWLQEIWCGGSLEVVDRLGASEMLFHCELGPLRSRAEIRRRYWRLLQPLTGVELMIDALLGSQESAACRWRITATSVDAGNRSTGGRPCDAGGSTEIRQSAGRICEVTEFLDPRTAFEGLLCRANGDYGADRSESRAAKA